MKMNEKLLIERLKKRDKKAQKYLFDKYAGLFFAISIRYADNYDDAQDILQEGFIKIFLNIDKFSGKGSFEGWMKRIIINNAINHYHKEIKHRYHDDISESFNIESDDKFYNEKDFTYDELIKIINDLPAGYRTIFNLYAIEGYKHKEIAKMLDISESTSKSQYHRAKKILQIKLEEIKIKKNEG
jgi:RNA polymerase sigma-70 factor (ECF subfamily)